MEQHNDYRPHWRTSPGMIPALVIIGIGLLFLLSNLHVVYMEEWYRYWPVLVIGAGVAKLVDGNTPRNRIMGIAWTLLGVLFLANNFNVIVLTWNDFWPVVLIGVGIFMLWNRLSGPHAWQQRARPTSYQENVYGNAVFSGFKRKITESDFRGGFASAIFGGGELNLRQAGMAGDSAVLEVSAIFGGIEIKVPRNWLVLSQGTGVFGGFVDETEQPREDTPGLKRLIVKGEAVFGGVSIKN